MPRGQVKWFDPKKGYGFIFGPEGQDVFVHYSHIQADGFRALKDGEWVDYELVQGDKGWQSREVRQVEPGPPADVAGGPGGGFGGEQRRREPSSIQPPRSGGGYERPGRVEEPPQSRGYERGGGGGGGGIEEED